MSPEKKKTIKKRALRGKKFMNKNEFN